MTVKITPTGDPAQGKCLISYRRWRWGRWRTFMYDSHNPYLFSAKSANFFARFLKQV